jgi:hypothetical protein
MSGDRDVLMSMYQHASDVRNNGLPGESTADWNKKDHRSEKDLPDEPVVLTEEQLVQDKNFQQLASTVYDFFNPSNKQVWSNKQIATAYAQGADEAYVKRMAFRSTRTKEENPQERAEWLASHYGWFNGNITAMAWDWNKLRNAPKDLQQSWAQGYLLYAKTPDTRKQVARATVAAIVDLPNLLGFSLLAKGAARGLSGMAVRGKIFEMANGFAKSNVKVGMTEGAAYGAAFSMAEQDLKTKGGVQPHFDWMNVGINTGASAVFGAGIGKAVDKVPQWAGKGMDKVREVAADIDMTGVGGAGYVPTDVGGTD